MKNFNGKFGCIKCLHPTISSNRRSVYPSLNMLQKLQQKFNFNCKRPQNKISITRAIKLRSHKIYLEQSKKAHETGEAVEGVLGISKLSDWVDIPNAIYLGKMHLCDSGTFKKMFKSSRI